MANFASEFFGLVFSKVSGHPKNSRPKFTSRIVGIPLQFHFLEPNIYSRRFSAYGGDQNLRLKRTPLKIAPNKKKGGPGSFRLLFVHGTVRAVPVFGSDGSPLERFFSLRICFSIFSDNPLIWGGGLNEGGGWTVQNHLFYSVV